MTWLDRTKDLFTATGASYRSVARRSPMSHQYVADILTGKTVPSLPMLVALLNGLTSNPAMVQSIMKQFMEEVPDYVSRRGRGKLPALGYEASTPPSSEDIQALTAAINNLTDAIRGHRRNEEGPGSR